MDDIVKQAIAKWPRVPAVHGWLGLDMRGRWYLRDDATQAQGPFPQARGSLLEHEKLLEFIARNYEADPQGRWFFQNGPQRVFVELELTPWIWRVQPDFSVVSHTGRGTSVEACLLDEEGRLYLATPLGLGLVHTQDVPLAAEAIEAGRWLPESVHAAELPARYGYVVSPQADALAVGKGPSRA